MSGICILPVGDVEDDVLTGIEGGVRRTFGLGTRRMAPVACPAAAFDTDRRQHNSVIILREAARRVPADAVRLLAVADVDAFIPMLSFVFGQAQVGGAAALISLARFHQEFYGAAADRTLTIARSVKEAIHEIGHTFGLVHCPDPLCPMSLSNTIVHVDAKGEEMCTNCFISLEELMSTVRRDLRRGETKETGK